MSFATVEDVQARFDRDLTDREKGNVGEWIQDLESDIRSRIPNVDELMANPDTGQAYSRTVTRVIAETIIPKLRNPKGLRQYTESVDDYALTETVDSVNSSGRLFITEDNWGLLIPSLEGDAYSIRLMGRFR